MGCADRRFNSSSFLTGLQTQHDSELLSYPMNDTRPGRTYPSHLLQTWNEAGPSTPWAPIQENDVGFPWDVSPHSHVQQMPAPLPEASYSHTTPRSLLPSGPNPQSFGPPIVPENRGLPLQLQHPLVPPVYAHEPHSTTRSMASHANAHTPTPSMFLDYRYPPSSFMDPHAPSVDPVLVAGSSTIVLPPYADPVRPMVPAAPFVLSPEGSPAASEFAFSPSVHVGPSSAPTSAPVSPTAARFPHAANSRKRPRGDESEGDLDEYGPRDAGMPPAVKRYDVIY
jgi:hypothetical protein